MLNCLLFLQHMLKEKLYTLQIFFFGITQVKSIKIVNIFIHLKKLEKEIKKSVHFPTTLLEIVHWKL